MSFLDINTNQKSYICQKTGCVTDLGTGIRNFTLKEYNKCLCPKHAVELGERMRLDKEREDHLKLLQNQGSDF